MKITVSNHLIITRAPVPLRDTITLRFRLTNPAWLDNQKMNRWQGRTPQFLNYAEKTPEGLTLPRGAGRDVLALCREMRIRAEIIDHTRTLPEVDFQFAGELRGYQSRAPGKTTAKIYDYVDGMVPVLAASAKARQRVYEQKSMITPG